MSRSSPSRDRAGHSPAPLKRQTLEELHELQRLALNSIRYPLAPSGRTQAIWKDGRSTREVVSSFIKPNDRLTSVQRLEIYNRQYWYRLLDCLYDDYPGLQAIIGERKFMRLRTAYLDRYPSNSFTLRDLGSRLVQFIEERPEYVAPNGAMALDMARFEWAQIVAFDGPAYPSFTTDDLLGKNPDKLRLGLQPYVTLVTMSYPLDDFVIAVKKQVTALRSEASNAIEEGEKRTRPARRIPLPKPLQTYLAVHRLDNDLYYKRLEPTAYTLLCALRDGTTLSRACATAISSSRMSKRAPKRSANGSGPGLSWAGSMIRPDTGRIIARFRFAGR